MDGNGRLGRESAGAAGPRIVDGRGGRGGRGGLGLDCPGWMKDSKEDCRISEEALKLVDLQSKFY